AAQRCFRVHAARDDRRHAAERNAYIMYCVAVQTDGRCEAYLGDRLRLARADFSIRLHPRSLAARKRDALDDLARRQIHLLVAGVKTMVADATRPAYRNQVEL